MLGLNFPAATNPALARGLGVMLKLDFHRIPKISQMPIVATQSISSLRSALGGDEAWRTLLQCFRTKVFLATSDEFTARIAAELCGISTHQKRENG